MSKLSERIAGRIEQCPRCGGTGLYTSHGAGTACLDCADWITALREVLALEALDVDALCADLESRATEYSQSASVFEAGARSGGSLRGQANGLREAIGVLRAAANAGSHRQEEG